MNPRKDKKKTETDVVADLQSRTRQAQELAAIPRQDLLADPRLNPATRQEADRLQAERLAVRLELEHKRYLRKEREKDRRAEEKIRAAEAVDRARAATDPAYTVLELSRSRGRFAALSLGASLVLSVGSAMGLEAAVQTHYAGAPTGIGYLAEVALTGMSTAAIVWAGLLARANAFPEGGRRSALIGLIVVPLLVSIVGSTIGSGPVGAVASLGAAAFSWFAYLIAVTSADAITQLVDRLKGAPAPADEDGDAQEHEDDDRGRRELPPLPRRSDRGLTPVGEALAEEATDYLRWEAPGTPDGDDGGAAGDTAVIPGGDDGPISVLHPPREADHGGEDDGPTGAPPALEDAARRRSREARERVQAYFREHPDASTRGAADALGVDPKTVRKYRPDADGPGGAP